MIVPHHFYDLLDCLAGQFFRTGNARCSGDQFGIHISLAAKEYFTVSIIEEELDNNKAVLGVLVNDAVHEPSRNGYTFVIYIDPRRISGKTKKILTSIILAHEICHFAYYYELFLAQGDNTGIVTHSKFTHIVNHKLINAIIEEQDSTSQTNLDEHDISELINNYRKFPKRHFSKGRDTKIDYKRFLDDFFGRLKIGEMINEHLEEARSKK